ncbi:pyridoxal-dependent decarboxylase, exosortase A system-associated [Thalassotalea maritima]|uniref:pyridoxal-dependent decarboxylase, exosortase A system-associated n=1 Tax=Thalassotalea maritima TaxID=3242416 RepID=UPI0035285EE7
MNSKPTHQQHPLLNTDHNEVHIGGKSVSEIKHILGDTPFYAYDRAMITERVTTLRAMLPDEIKLHYAIKANPFAPVVHHLANLVDGFDVASSQEMLIALQTGMLANEISFAGPGKSDDDLLAAIIAGVVLHIESKNELARAIDIANQQRLRANIALRINPAFELKSSGMKMAGGPKQFGIDEEQVADLLQSLDHQTINFKGFHIFAGSQNLNNEAIIEAQQNTFRLAATLCSLLPENPEYINIGGGLGIPYFPGEQSLPLSAIADNLSHLLEQYQAQLNGVDIVMELGRYFVAEAGVYVCQVVDVKHSRGENYLVCDGGLHHHLANSGNFGQVLRKNYPVAVANKLQQEKDQMYQVVGPLCTPLDIVASNLQAPDTSVGDLIAVMQSGAYGYSASPHDFLSQKQCQQILL